MLDERPAGAGEVVAAPQSGVEGIQDWVAQLAQIHLPEGRDDGAPDVAPWLSRVDRSDPGEPRTASWPPWHLTRVGGRSPRVRATARA